MESIGSNSIVKIIHVVHDLEKTLDNMVEIFGIDRPELIRGNAESREATGGQHFTSYHSEDINAPLLLANVDMGPIVMEVIQPLDNLSPWADFLKDHGEGIYSVVYTVAGFHHQIESMGKENMPNFHLGEYSGGRYGYWDTKEKIGFVLGLQEFDNQVSSDN